MQSDVFFIDLRTSPKENILEKLCRLLDKTGLFQIFTQKDLVAVKLHFGELGNTAYIRPVFLRKIVDIIKNAGGNPFLTDANTLYSGTRSDAPCHIGTAVYNGFSYSTVNAPVIIADGLRGKTESLITINQKRFKKVYIGSEIVQADSILSVAHFKCHELSGFGGTIKNLGMGCASRRGKLAQHSTVNPKIIQKRCIGCGDCTSHCSQNALSVIDKKAVIDSSKCIGCSECIIICSNEAIDIDWNQSVPIFLENMVEYTMGVLKGKKGKTLFLNFITNVSPACDCYSHNDAPIVRDIGIVASIDPVAIDQASADLVNKEAAIKTSCLKANLLPGEDKFKGVYPNVDWEIQLEYAQAIGLGSRDYNLVKI